MKKWFPTIDKVEAGDGPLGAPELLIPQDLLYHLRCTGAELRYECAGLVCSESTVHCTLSPVSQVPARTNS